MVGNQFNIFSPVGIAMIGVLVVRYPNVTMSEPIICKWCPHTIRPRNVVVKIAINIESRPKILHRLYLDSISLIIPNAGIISIWASGWLRDQNKCWGEINSPPRNGSKKLVLECLSNVIIVIRPANTGRGIINKNGVKNILRGNNGINNTDCKIANDVPFNIVTIRLIDPNKGLNPTKCKGKH